VAAAKKQAQDAGLTTVMDESYPPSTTDFTAVINKVISSGADAFLGGGHYPDGATLARQMYDQKAPLKWVSILVAPDSPKFATLGDAAVGITVPSQWEPAVQYKPQFGPTVAQFTKEFESKFNIGVDYHAASGYQQGLLLQKAIEEAGSISPEKVAAKLNDMDVTTFFGNNKFATGPKDHGLQLAHKMVLAQWQTKDGKPALEMVWPTEAATAKIVYPAR
jgi:branched-chain amino acid transport system substrate-binding protein